MRLMPRHIHFHVSISALVLMLVLATAGLSLLTVVGESSRTADKTAERQFQQISDRVQDRLATLVGEVEEETAILARQPTLGAPIAIDGTAHPSYPLLSAILRNKPVFYSAYFAHHDGSFLQVIATRGNQRILDAHKAPMGTEMIVRSVTIDGSGARRQHWIYLGADEQRLGQSDDTDFSYDPRNRVWFGMAASQVAATLSPPYLFDSLKAPGITAAHRLNDADGVVGVDLTLAGLQVFLDEFEVSPHGGVMLLDEQSRIMAFSGKTLDKREWPEPMEAMAAHRRYPFVQVETANPTGLTLVKDGVRPIIVYRTLWGGGTTTPIHLAVFAPEGDFTGHIDVMRRHILIINGLLLLIALPIVSWSARRLARPVDHLAADAERIRAWDFSGVTPTGSIIVEIDSLAHAFVLMKRSLIERTRKLEQTQESLRKLVDLAIALSAERDSNRLMDMILSGAKDLANADGGTLYIRDDGERLIYRIMKNDSLNIDIGADGRTSDIPPVPLFDPDGAENHHNVVSHSVHLRRPTNIEDVHAVPDHEFSGTSAFDERHGYRSVALLTVPLAPRGGDPLGAIQLINPLDPETGRIIPFSPEIERFVQALSALAATVLHNRNLLDSQKNLVDSLIRILASAIDAKSPYTGAHCARVPELAFMLAREACNAQTGPLADFRFDTEEQWDEFRIGAWLHDCGKVTTPEYVIDKATKLETIHNRIHEIRTRFEVLLRDAEIAALNARLAGTDAEDTARRLEEQRQTLFDDFAFVATCNIGSESMDLEKIERLRAVAWRPWVRHFDDRLGLSIGELSRLAKTPAKPLPAIECLLSDRPEHIVPRDPRDGFFDARFGFQMTVPEHLYNLGEIYNLSISRGTLTPEERFKINEHIVHTIIMLDSLDFPKHLRRVPEYAGTHHETLIGTGYPRRLTGEQLSIPARIMVIADIFEALTAADRPYKKPKTLSDAVEILSQFAQKQHIDPDLFRLFLKSGVYRRYAEAFLAPEQNDAVDINQYLDAEKITST